MLKEVIDFINDQRTLDPHYLKNAAKTIGMDYNNLYRIVTGSRKGSAMTLEKMWMWYQDELKKRKEGD